MSQLRPAAKPVRVKVPEFRAYVRQMPCLLFGQDHCTCGGYLNVVSGRIASDCAHVKSRGSGGADVENCVPLCRTHHGEQHRIGTGSFQARHREDLGGMTLKEIAVELWHDWPDRAAWEREQENGA